MTSINLNCIIKEEKAFFKADRLFLYHFQAVSTFSVTEDIMDQAIRTKLELIRLEGIVKMLYDTIDHEELKDTVHSVLQTDNENIIAELERASRYQLILIAEQHDDVITYGIVSQYYDQYRYGLRPGFTVYLLIGPQIDIDAEAVFSQLKALLEDLPEIDETPIKRIRCKSFTQLADSIAEFSLSYLKKHSYLDENEKPQYIYEYEEFFLWLNIPNQYLAIRNVPDKVSDTVIKLLQEILHLGVTYIKLTKPIIDSAFGTEQRKGTYLKLNAANNEPEKVTFSDPKLQEKEQVLSSVSTYSMTSALLTQTMEDNSINTLGINCDKGKIYLTKNVPASTFREWSVSAIQRIIPLVTDYQHMSDFQSFKARNLINHSNWSCTRTQALILEKIAYGIFESIKTNHSIAYMNTDVKEIWSSLPKYWLPRYTGDCPVCGEKSLLYCPTCGKATHLMINKKGLMKCTYCDDTLYCCNCDQGHTISIQNTYETLTLLPNAFCLEEMHKIIHDELMLPFHSTFQIISNRIELYPLQDFQPIQITDIPELKKINDVEISDEAEYHSLLSEIQALKEKCPYSRYDTCNSCSFSGKNKCLMKVFTTFSDYRPSPHNGHEFADVSFTITVSGNPTMLVGVMKSATNQQSSLTRSSEAAREMLQQSFLMAQDNRVGIIAAICPSRFQAQFIADLYYLSRITKKPIIVMDDLYMCKQLKAFKSLNS